VTLGIARAVLGLPLLLGGSTARGDSFDDCIPKPGSTPQVTVEHEGKTYGLRSEPCRVEFLSDPERYAQLYDALLELQRSGQKAPEKGPVSLVPS
jgi:YHS domain-containing protein